MSQPYVLCSVGGTCYGVPALAIAQVEMPGLLTRVPQADPHVEGVVALRGQVVPQLSLRRRFGLDPQAPGRLVVVQEQGRTVALAVDEARDFVELSPEAILPPGPELPSYVGGVVQRAGSLILLLQVESLLQPLTKETS